jgi:hypothetical protein
MFDAPLGQHLRASQSPVEHRLRDIHLVSQSPITLFHFPQNLQANPELAENSSLLARAELHYRHCNNILDK